MSDKAPIYKGVLVACAVVLYGQCLRIIATPFLPREDNTVAPYPMPKPEAQQTLEMAAVYGRNTELLLALQGNALCDGQYNQPLFQPCGQAMFDPLPTVPTKPERK